MKEKSSSRFYYYYYAEESPLFLSPPPPSPKERTQREKRESTKLKKDEYTRTQDRIKNCRTIFPYKNTSKKTLGSRALAPKYKKQNLY